MVKKEIEKIIKKIQNDSHKKMEKLFELHKEYANDKFKAVNEELQSINKKLSKNEKISESHGEKLTNALVDLNGIKIDMGKVSYEVKMHIDQKIDKKHFVDLEGRVRVLEKK